MSLSLAGSGGQDFGQGNLLSRAEGPQAVVLEPSGNWLGNDGNWSTFQISVGTPSQTFNVLVSTARYEISVPNAEGCLDGNWDIDNCGSLRGAEEKDSNGFNQNGSSTWDGIGNFVFSAGRSGYSTSAAFGYDTITFGSGELSLEDQLLASFPEPSFWLGFIGLDWRPTVFGDRSPSPMQALKDGGKIPSLSFGYTAGASYRSNPGSLTLGGYDRALMNSSQVTASINVGQDSSGSFMLALHSIEATNTTQGDVTLSDTTLMIPIDSTVSELWLPRSVCDRFEQAFNLRFVDSNGRYVINETTHDQLQESNPTVTFAISDESGENSTTITFPYAAFDLEASYRIFRNGNSQLYFPIRRAANESEYTLGRVFLQEAYLMADWERETFTVAQTIFSDPMPSRDIVTIEPTADGEVGIGPNSGGEGEAATSNGESTGSRLGAGAIAGIAIGAVAGVATVAALLYFFVWRRRGQKTLKSDDGVEAVPVPPTYDEKHHSLPAYQANTPSIMYELDNNETRSPVTSPASELRDPISEIGPVQQPVEMESPVPTSELEAVERRFSKFR